MADSSTAAGPILDLIAGDRWARRQLRSGIKDVSVASELMKSLTLVRVVFIGTLAIPELDGRFLHKRLTDSRSDCGRLLVLTPATQRYKGRLCRIETHEIADPCGGVIFILVGTLAIPELDGRFLHSRWADPGSDCGGSLGSTPATQRYKGRVCRIETHEIANPCESCLYRYPGDPRTRWQIPSQARDRFLIRLREVVGLDASYAAV